jgi:hypothetical protein
MDIKSDQEFLEKKRTNKEDILSVSFHNINTPKIEGTSSPAKIQIKSQPNTELSSALFSEEKTGQNSGNNTPKKIEPKKKEDTNDLFMSQFMSGMDKESDELFKMIKGAIDEDPSQKLLTQKFISTSNNNKTTNTNINTNSNIISNNTNNNITTSNNIDNNKYDPEEFKKSVEAEIAKQNALLENPNLTLSKPNPSSNPESDINNDINTDINTNNENTDNIVENPPYEPELDNLREKVEEKLEKVFEKNLAERQAYEAEMDKMFEEKRDGLKVDYEEELYDDLGEDLDEIDLNDILSSEAYIDFYYPKSYQPNFESPIFTIISVVMDKYGYNLVLDMIIRNDKKKRILVDKKDFLDNDDTTFNIKKYDDLNNPQMEIDNEDKKEEQKGENNNAEGNKEQNGENKSNNSEAIQKENKTEEKKENLINDNNSKKTPVKQKIDRKNDLSPNKLKNRSRNITPTKLSKHSSEIIPQNKEEKKEIINNLNVAQQNKEAENKMQIENNEDNLNNTDINMLGIENMQTNSPKPNPSNQNDENQNQNITDNQMPTELPNDISQNFLMDNSSLLSQENIPLSEDELKMKNILNTLVTISGYCNVIFFTLQYGKYLKNLQRANSSQCSDDGVDDDDNNQDDNYTNDISDNEINKLKKIEHYTKSYHRRKRKQKMEKMMKKGTYMKKDRDSDYFENKKNYYEKGGRVGMHYHTSEDDGNIYKYYCVQYNNDGTVGFKCTEPNCRSKAIMDPRKKTFTIISKHMLSFKEHKKLHGSYLRDRYIKFMIHKKIREVQLTKKNDKKIIEWYK